MTNDPRRKRQAIRRPIELGKPKPDWTTKDKTAKRESAAIRRLNELRPAIVGRGLQCSKQCIFGSQFYKAIAHDYRPAENIDEISLA